MNDINEIDCSLRSGWSPLAGNADQPLHLGVAWCRPGAREGACRRLMSSPVVAPGFREARPGVNALHEIREHDRRKKCSIR